MSLKCLDDGSCNLTCNKIRRTCGPCSLRKYLVDPAFGIPLGGTPMFQDPVTSAVRPFSSAVTLSLAVDNFVGFTVETFEAGECHTVQIASCGWVEMQTATPVASIPGEKYTFATETVNAVTFVSNTIVVANGTGILEAVEECACNCQQRLSCPPDPAAPADVSPTLLNSITRPTKRCILLAFDAGRC